MKITKIKKNSVRTPEKYKRYTPPEALQTAQRITALVNTLSRYTGDAEAKKINALFFKRLFSYFQLRNNMIVAINSSLYTILDEYMPEKEAS